MMLATTTTNNNNTTTTTTNTNTNANDANDANEQQPQQAEQPQEPPKKKERKPKWMRAPTPFEKQRGARLILEAAGLLRPRRGVAVAVADGSSSGAAVAEREKILLVSIKNLAVNSHSILRIFC